MTKNYYVSGEWNLICDICSKKIKASDAKTRWDGLIVCPNDFEHRHPQDFVRARQDKISVPFQRPIQTPEYFVCLLEHTVGIAGIGVAGCLVSGKTDIFGK